MCFSWCLSIFLLKKSGLTNDNLRDSSHWTPRGPLYPGKSNPPHIPGWPEEMCSTGTWVGLMSQTVASTEYCPFVVIRLPWWLRWKESACNAGDLGLIPGSGKIPWRRERLPTPVFLPGEFQARGPCQAIVHGVAKSQTWPSNWTTTTTNVVTAFADTVTMYTGRPHFIQDPVTSTALLCTLWTLWISCNTTCG